MGDTFKLGRQKRKFDSRIAKFSDIPTAQLAPAPMVVDYSQGLPDNLGAMLNDSLGDCTCAAFYHARQIWTFDAQGTMTTEPDENVRQMYEESCDYNPAVPASDNGGCEQDILKYLLQTGAPVGIGLRDKILAYIEVDPENLDDLKRAIAEFGVAYVGIDVPQSVMDNAENNNIWWDTGGDETIVGGHAIILIGYDLDTFTCISWGKRYKITHEFMSYFLEEAYALADLAWIEATGKSPMGLTVQQLEYYMENLRNVD